MIKSNIIQMDPQQFPFIAVVANFAYTYSCVDYSTTAYELVSQRISSIKVNERYTSVHKVIKNC